MSHRFTELFGWYGAAAVIGAYGLSSFNVLSAHSLVYQLLNLSGAIGIMVVSLKKRTYQTVATNFVWSVIALVAIAGIVLGH